MEPFALHGDRVLLSVPTETDVDRITELCQDPDIQAWTTVPAPYRREHAVVFVRDYVRPGWVGTTSLTWAIRDPTDHRAVGMLGMALTGDGNGEVGFWLAPDARGRGMMSEAIRLVADRVFADASLRLTHLIWWAYVGNWASRRVAWATGFRHEGTVRGGQPQRGRRRDAWVATLRNGDPMQPGSLWLDIPTVAGERATLRQPVDEDADALVEACSDPTAQWWLAGLPRPYTRDDALGYVRQALEEAASGRELRWVLADPASGAAIGSCSLRLAGRRKDEGVIGYLVHPAVRGRGVATEAAKMMVRHAFLSRDDGGLGLRRVLVEHAEGNDHSRGVVERLGFRHAGVDREVAELGDGTFTDHHRYDLLATEFT